MPAKNSDSLVLTLADGTKISGRSFGADFSSSAVKPAHFGEGEVVFSTGMVGYTESFTDPSFAGQILVLTYPLVGNYGIPGRVPSSVAEVSQPRSEAKRSEASQLSASISQNFESDRIQIAGLVVSEYSEKYSHHEAVESLADWLKREKIPAITGVDTRALTQKLREHGTMLGRLTTHNSQLTTHNSFYDPNRDDLVARVSPKEAKFYDAGGKKTIAILDCGMKLGILRDFLKRGVNVHHLPHDHDLSDIKYDGLFISNGPGDPKLAKKTIATIRRALPQKKPIFGICLGHQLLALAAGLNTAKLPYGHRSQNQPVREIATGRCYVTSQNHGFAVTRKVKDGWLVSHENINDGSVEGLRHKKLPYFSVQYHPEACPGPTDASYLFDEFVRTL